MRAYAVCVRFHQVGATRGYYSRVGQPPQVASGASPPFIPSCLLSLLHPYKGGDMGGRRTFYSAGLFTRDVRLISFINFTADIHSDIMLGLMRLDECGGCG